MLPRKPYDGLTRKLVLAFDVGTTFSGVSYCILNPGEVPVIRRVSRFPAQEQVGGDSKIPSIIYYDLQGNVRAVGAEALQERIIEQAKGEGWVKLEWWKLHLRSKHLASSHIQEDDIPPLPRGKPAVQVLADFVRYLFQCARTYIQELHLNLWRSVENSIEFILTHPNGWEGPQQQQIRRAVELAGLISSQEEQSHVHLLTEGEASLHFCVASANASDAFSSPVAVSDSPVEEEGQTDTQGVVIVDAGDGTIDLNAYSMKLSPTSFEEIAPAECCLQGSAFVTRRAHTLLQNKLSGSNYDSPEMIAHMTNVFDKTTKLQFHTPDESYYIKFGTINDNDPNYDIQSGQLMLAGQDVADLFDPSVQAIINAFEQQRRVASTPINCVFLIGGFAASDWLFVRLQGYFRSHGISLYRPESHVNQAVPDGAASFYSNKVVPVDGAVPFYSNKATPDGAVSFYNNKAALDGAISFDSNKVVPVDGAVSFYNNKAAPDGAVSLDSNKVVPVDGTVSFCNNKAAPDGAVSLDSNKVVPVDAPVSFYNNKAAPDGAVSLDSNEVVPVDGAISFYNNKAAPDGAVSFDSNKVVPVDRVVSFYSNKAVPNGAVSFYIDHLVSSRVARATYGVEVYTSFDYQDPEHQARRHTQFTDAAGMPSIPKQFASILLKGTQVSELREFRSAFCFVQKSRHIFNSSVDIMSYKGDLQQPKWLDVERSSFSTLCTIHPHMSELLRTLHPKRSALDRSNYYQIDFEVVLLFGLTELKAQISWKYKGVEMRSPASIVYEE